MRRGSSKDESECSSCACTGLRQAARAITQLYDEAFRSIGYRATQVGILTTLEQTGAVTLSELAEQSVTDRTTLTRNLRLLEKKGLVCVELGSDRREHRICLTKKGEQVVQMAYPKWAAVQQKVVRRIGKQRHERLMADLLEMVKIARNCG